MARRRRGAEGRVERGRRQRRTTWCPVPARSRTKAEPPDRTRSTASPRTAASSAGRTPGRSAHSATGTASGQRRATSAAACTRVALRSSLAPSGITSPPRPRIAGSEPEVVGDDEDTRRRPASPPPPPPCRARTPRRARDAARRAGRRGATCRTPGGFTGTTTTHGAARPGHRRDRGAGAGRHARILPPATSAAVRSPGAARASSLLATQGASGRLRGTAAGPTSRTGQER